MAAALAEGPDLADAPDLANRPDPRGRRLGPRRRRSAAAGLAQTRRRIAALCLGASLAFAPAMGFAASAARATTPARPGPGDDSIASLARYQDALLAAWGGDHRQIPLEAKAAHFEWLLWRYHDSPWGQVATTVMLPEAPGEPVVHRAGADVATWNGALLAALSLRYAATRDPATLERIETLLRGLSRYQEVTGVPGLLARTVLASETPVHKANRPWRAPDGTGFHYRGVPAKGTYTQVAVGYASLATHAAAALPGEARERARRDFAAIASHLVEGGWRILDAEGEKTKYGDVRPEWGPIAVPFQSHVAWLIAATAEHYPPREPAQHARLASERQRLARRHPFWVHPWRPCLHPQRLGASRLIGANDRNHLISAAYTALVLERDAAGALGRPPDPEIVVQLADALRYAARRLPEHRNSLANIAWAATVSDRELLAALVPDRNARARVRADASQLLDQAVEQLRRFPLDRQIHEGFETREGGPYWMDEYRPDNYAWKIEPDRRYTVTGPPTRYLRSAVDFLHAYWLLRQTRLDRSPALAARHGPVLRRRLPMRAEPDLDLARR